MFHGHLDYFPKPPLGGRANTKPGDHGTLDAHNHLFNLFYCVWGPTRIRIHWNSIWLRAWLHVALHYTWGSLTTLHDFGGVLGWPLNTFFRALMSWSWLLARVWSGPEGVWPLHFQALSLVEQAEPVQVWFKLGSRDQRIKWIQDGCKVYIISYVASNGSCFMVTLNIKKKTHLLKVGLTQKPEHHGTPKFHNYWFIM